MYLMKSLRLISLILFLTNSFFGFGQEIKIVDAISALPMEGVALYNNSKSKATLTNTEGIADLSIFEKGEIINVQYYGYESRNYVLNSVQSSELFQFNLYPKDQTLDEIVLSVARSASKRKQIAEKVDILSARDILNLRPSTGADLVGISPGVRIQKSQGGGGSPVIRGFEANRILLVVDGVRLNNAIFRSGHLQNALTVHPNIIERVEVIYGSSSVGYGSDALGGVIHYYTRNPLINSENRVKTQFSSDFSSANFATINSLSSEVSFKKWASLTSLSHSNFGDLRMGKNRQHGFAEWGLTPYYSSNSRSSYSPKPLLNDRPNIQKNSGYSQVDLLQKFLVQLNDQNQFALNLQYSNSSDVPRYDKLVEQRNGSLRFAEWYYGPQKRFLISPQLKLFPEKKYLNSGKITFAHQKLEESRIKRDFNSLTRNYQIEKVGVFNLNGDFEFQLPEDHSFSYGFEAVNNQVGSYAYKQDLVVQQNTIVGLTPTLPIATRYPSGGSSYASYAVYLNWIWDLSNQLTFNGGIRISSTHLKGSWKEYYNINALLSKVKLDSEALTGTIALTYRPNSKTKFSSILSNGFRNPNIDDVGKIRESKGVLIVPNPLLFPEYAYNFELGITQYLNEPKNYFSVRGFSTLISRHIGRDKYVIFADRSTPDPNTINYNGEEVITYANNNLGNRYLVGASMDGNFSFSKSLALSGDFNLIHAFKEEQYGPLPSISPSFGTVKLTYQKAAWLVRLLYQFSGSKDPEDYSFGGEDGLEETPLISESLGLYAGTPAWKEASFFSQYQWNKQLYVRLGLDNIFDVHYRTFASGISAPGRNFKVGLYLEF